VLQEVTYETVLKRLRRQYHLRAAEWLKEQTNERTSELTGLIAAHLEKGGDLAEAIRLLTQAGDEAAGKYLNQEAIQFYSRALAQTPGKDRLTQADLLLKREKLYGLLGMRQPQEADLKALNLLLEAEGEALQDRTRKDLAAETQLEWGWFYLSIGDSKTAIEQSQEALQMAEAAQASGLALQATTCIVNGLYQLGEYAQGRKAGEAGLQQARQENDLFAQSRLTNILGLIAADQKDWAGSQAYLDESLAIAQAMGDPRGEARSRGNLAMLAGFMGQLSKAEQEYQSALILTRSLGERAGEANMLDNLGWLRGMWGDFQAAANYSQQSLHLALEIGDRRQEMASLVNLSAYLGRQGDFTASLEHAEKGLKLARETKSLPWIAWGLTYQGHALCGLGQTEAAGQAYHEAAALRLSLSQPLFAAEPQAGLARLALAAGNLAEAASFVQPILELLEQGSTLDGVDEPLRVLLTCAQVLKAAEDERWRELVKQACQRLRILEASAPDEATRRKLLEVSWNREIEKMAE
jgi:predicted ATPase